MVFIPTGVSDDIPDFVAHRHLIRRAITVQDRVELIIRKVLRVLTVETFWNSRARRILDSGLRRQCAFGRHLLRGWPSAPSPGEREPRKNRDTAKQEHRDCFLGLCHTQSPTSSEVITPLGIRRA